ncbi:MAG: Lrp/AsnC family transcriptional regulator [Actinomycetota bacterium]
MELDSIDSLILRELQVDGRVTSADLGDRVGLSASSASRRVRRLEEGGIIDRYVALLDPAVIGRTVSVFVEISLASQAEDLLDEFEAAIADIPGVMTCHLMAGEADYLIHVMCADVADYERIHRQHLAVLPHVARLRSSFAIRQVSQRTDFDLG